MTRFLLVRHAAALADGDLRLPGPDVALTAAGKTQARQIANRLLDFAPGRVCTSDARRARQTGEFIAAKCHAPLQVIPALREIDLGAWAGRTFADIVAADPTANDWFTDPTKDAPPGGEHIADAADRVHGLLQALAHSEEETLAIVGHAGSLRLAVAQALGMPLRSYWRLQLDCASLSVVTWTEDGPLLELWNDASHLQPESDFPTHSNTDCAWD